MKRLPYSLCLGFLLAAASLQAQGVRECATCHPAQAKPHPATSMAHALETAADCAILKTHAVLTFTDGRFSYRIERKEDSSLYTVSDGAATLTAPLRWAIGLGSAGQTYVYEQNGALYQSRVSFYRDINGLAPTLGATNAKPANLTEAAGEHMDETEQRTCFGCHATNAVAGKRVTLAAMTPGVQCERCHGESNAHLKGIASGNSAQARMQQLGKFNAEETANFCGQCHRTWEQIASSGIHGVVTVRFQPYRLTNSKCYDADDRRISCVGCHDPHREINRVDASYDRNCQACHAAGGKATAPRCKIAKSDCVSCHMPKVEIPGSHHQFTDHDIRIARANAPYPD